MNANTMNMGTGPASSMGNRFEDEVADRAESAVNETAGRAHEAVERVAPNVDRMAAKAHQTIDTVAARAQDTARRVTDTTSQYADQWSAYVRERPLASVGIALAVGYVVGRIMR